MDGESRAAFAIYNFGFALIMACRHTWPSPGHGPRHAWLAVAKNRAPASGYFGGLHV